MAEMTDQSLTRPEGLIALAEECGAFRIIAGELAFDDAALAAFATALAREQEAQPPYPVGDVVGPCVCGSWPGGKCLKCKWIPAAQPAAQEPPSDDRYNFYGLGEPL